MGTLYEEVRAALGESGFKPRKRLGQNFLIHERIIESILRLLGISSADEILEIGPGLGFLTRRLVERAAKVWAVEVDPFLVDWMQRGSLGNHPKLELIEADILKVRLDEVLPSHKVKLVGNLPYSISTPALFRLFEWRERFSSMVLMVQKEVADRIASEPGVKAYGTLSVWSQVHGRITDKIPVSTEAFYPRPKVRSTVLKIELFSEPLIAATEMPQLRGLVRSAFGQRRKTFANALTSRLKRNRAEIEEFLRAEGVDPSRRGETLRVEDFIHLARALPRYGLLIPER
jgi:16S rRNA (adenine1518-N6/adenine1519-N6)-dimethyltransferase